jgi:hypothetical protein
MWANLLSFLFLYLNSDIGIQRRGAGAERKRSLISCQHPAYLCPDGLVIYQLQIRYGRLHSQPDFFYSPTFSAATPLGNIREVMEKLLYSFFQCFARNKFWYTFSLDFHFRTSLWVSSHSGFPFGNLECSEANQSY